MLGLSIVGGVVGTALITPRLDLGSLERDVVVDGPPERLVPGEIPFRVVEPLGDATEEMTVGVALDDTSLPVPECMIETADGDEAPWGRARVGDELYHGRRGYEVVGTARLGPGEYVARCDAGSGEPSESRAFTTNFTVGRVVAVDDLSPLMAPLFGLFGVWLLAGLLFIVGLVLLIIGLVQRSRSRRVQPAPWGGHPGQVPQGYGPPPGYGPPAGNGPPGYPPSGYGPPAGYGTPAYGPPHGDGPPSSDEAPHVGEASWPAGPPTSPPEVAWTQPPGAWTGAPEPEPQPERPPEESNDGSASGWTIPPSKRAT